MHLLRIIAKMILLIATVSSLNGCITQDGIMLGVPHTDRFNENDVEIRTNKCYGISLFWL